MKESGLMETNEGFAVIGATILDNFGLKMPENTIGESILETSGGIPEEEIEYKFLYY